MPEKPKPTIPSLERPTNEFDTIGSGLHETMMEDDGPFDDFTREAITHPFDTIGSGIHRQTLPDNDRPTIETPAIPEDLNLHDERFAGSHPVVPTEQRDEQPTRELPAVEQDPEIVDILEQYVEETPPKSSKKNDDSKPPTIDELLQDFLK